MKIGIIGFQRSGKTTVFNALTGSQVDTSDYSTKKRLAVVKVPDERVDRLVELFQPKKVVHASVEYIDLAGIDRGDGERGKGLGDEQISELAGADALLAIVRGFDDGSGIDPDVPGDVEAMELELIISDLQKVENRIPKLEKLVMKVVGEELEKNKTELAALQKIKACLDDETPLRRLELSDQEEKAVRGFTFLSQKPIFYLINVGEDLLGKDDILSRFQLPEETPDKRFAAMCGEIEAEIASLSPEERDIFLADYNIEKPSAERIISLCYELLGYISFFTVGPKEVHAWTITRGTPAVNAAGAIHSDMERGFIRAEVTNWEKLIEAGSFAQAQKNATLHIEGKNYIVRDGDIFHVRFSV